MADIDKLLMLQKGIGSGICHAIHRYTKANNKCMKDYDKYKESSYVKYWDVSKLYGWAMSQKLPVDSFKWLENISRLNKNFIETYNEDRDEGYFLEVDVQYPENLHNHHSDLPFLPKRMKNRKSWKTCDQLAW